MQPLYSVDHETRHSSNRLVEHSPTPGEGTPLLVRFPSPQRSERTLLLSVTISLLLIILVMGAIISIYLLILQNESENILPPIENPLRLVSKRQWGANAASSPATWESMRVGTVIAVHTATDQCFTTEACSKLLQELQATYSDKMLPWNFMIGSSGETYESIGWHRPSTLFPDKNALVIAFIGNFTVITPPPVLISAARNLLDESVSEQHLTPKFSFHGEGSAYKLFDALKKFPEWKNT